MTDRSREFREFRERMNRHVLEPGNLEMKRFFTLDARVYEGEALLRGAADTPDDGLEAEAGA